MGARFQTSGVVHGLWHIFDFIDELFDLWKMLLIWYKKYSFNAK